jgi:hypothetical protein
MANRNAFAKGRSFELPNCSLAVRALATGSAAMSRTPLTIIDVEALVTIAMAELVTAA